jgi:molecular chaperone GrpE
MANEAPEPEPPETVPLSPDAARLQRELEDARKNVEDVLTRLAYLQAELENTRKRAEREVDQAVLYANERLVSRLLPVLDDLDAAVLSARGKEGRGLEMIRENVVKALKESGLEEIPAEGLPFDPYVHECVHLVGDGALPDGHVKEVVQRGYTFRKKVLRPARVVVVKHPNRKHDTESEQEGEQDG